MAYYDEPVPRVMQDLATKEEGLSHEQAASRLRTYGLNELQRAAPQSRLVLLLRQFNNPVVWVLLAAVIITYFVGQHIDTYVILAILILDAVLGYVQEEKAEEAIAALKRSLSLKATVIRGGQIVVDAKDVVPGDILILESGTKVAADARIIWESSLSTQEAVVTGESTPVKKTIAALPANCGLADRTNMVFASTIITQGRGRAVVTATGMKTQVGTIANLLAETHNEPTPLQKKLASLSTSITLIILVIALIVFAAGMLEGQPLLTIFLASVALAVAAIPEGLPAVVTLALALGVQRLAARNALIRRLPSAETLGACTVICTDKTGTLTHNEMTIRELYVPHMTLTVSGAGYAEKGAIKGKTTHYTTLLRIGALCNNATAQGEGIVGDPTEAALLVSARKGGIDIDGLNRSQPRVGEIQFTSERKRMTTIHRVGRKRVAYTKGAPDIILGLCTKKRVDGSVSALTESDRKRILAANEDMARRALRVLGFAYRELGPGSDEAETHLVFAGLQGMIDPPREEAKEAVATAQRAGIRVVMITGDHPLTANAIARELGIPGKTMSGAELVETSDLADVIDTIGVFARVDPLHKLKIIEALKKRDHIVAMTGDGVNDAPALKAADIGIAMGRSGTDVAREASDMVLADDNFATIVDAVRGGRTILDNIIKFVLYMLSANTGEVLTLFFAMVLDFPLPMTATMILWLNLLTDGLPAIALTLDKEDPCVMLRKPLPTTEGVITSRRLLRILVIGFVLSVLTLILFRWRLADGIAYARSITFTGLVVMELAVALNTKLEHVTRHEESWFSNPWLIGSIVLMILLQILAVSWPPLQGVFGTVSLGIIDWLAIACGSAILFILASLLVPRKSTQE